MRLNIPTLGDEEVEAVGEVLRSGYLTQGPVAAQFENLVAAYVNAEFAFATSSATTALHLSLHAMGIGPGDEVVVPDFSFPATANVVVQTGATPVLVDIDLETYNLDPGQLQDAITPRTRAVMPVHAFGLCADMDAIDAVVRDLNVPVLEDAACALAAEYHGRPAGTLGTAAAFSFHPRKIITTGEGGMIVTSDADLAARIRVLRSHGGVRGELYLDFRDAGFNYRLSDVHAAIGVAQMARLVEIVAERRRLAGELSARLSGLPLTPPTAPPGLLHSFQSYVARLEPDIDRDEVIRILAADGIESTLGTYAMHLQPYFRDVWPQEHELPNATVAHRQCLTLPLYPGLTEGDLDRIAERLGRATARATTRPS